MANVLFLDTQEKSAYLAMSLFRGLGHRGSISNEHGDARAKLETALFDIVYVDICSKDPVADFLFVQYAATRLPGAPILRVVDSGLALPPQPVFADLVRPLTLDRLMDVARRATARLADLCMERRRFRRKDVSVEVTIGCEDRKTPARAVNLSLGGALVELPGFDVVIDPDSVLSLSLLTARRRLELRAQIAYAGIFPSGAPHLGLVFTGIGPEQMDGIQSVLEAA
ncbi:MAG: PilZ domain-containing protein [Planctomycetes bacterium]|nr:PilZ domain-containing protein [Planctomycetota bacterium]